jgi:hypothetical protein
MAEYVAELCMRESAGKDAPAAIYSQDSAARVKEALQEGRMLSIERLLYANPTAFKKSHLLYAYCLSFYKLLASDPQRLAKLHSGIRALGAGTAYEHSQACAKVLTDVYGPLDQLQKRWQDGVRKETAPWIQLTRSSQRCPGEIVCASRTDEWNLSCELMIGGAGDKQADILFAVTMDGRDDARYLKLCLGSPGFITLMGYSDGFWQTQLNVNHEVPAETFSVGKWVSVQAAVKAGRVTLAVNGKQLFEADVPATFDGVHGGWGLGTYNGAVRFRKVKLNGENVE